jgi:predicted HTH transcriptional regulator
VNKYIRHLISQGEGQQLDFKFEVSDARKLARTFSAFANTHGGRLLIGVKDNGSIAGIRTEEEVYMLESAAHLFCKPKVEYTVNSWQIEGKTILEITINESQEKPHTAPWKDELWRAFIRVNDQNFIANSVQIEVWKNLHSSKSTTLKYSRQEEQLLFYLKNHAGISLNGFCRLCNIKYPLARKILVNLCLLGIIQISYTGTAVIYQLNQDFTGI